MSEEKFKYKFTDYLVFILSSLAIFLSSILLVISFLLISIYRTFLKFLKVLIKKPVLILPCILIILSALFVFWFFFPVSWEKSETSTFLVVSSGDSFSKVASKLKEAGLISQPQLFSLVGKIAKVDKHILAGKYEIKKGESLFSILKKFLRGELSIIKLTIPEGMDIYEIASILQRELGVDSALFIQKISDSLFIRSLNLQASNLEGYLFPNTYNFYWGMEAQKIATIMVEEFKKNFADRLVSRAKEIGFSLHQALTFASLIEAEAKDGEERELVSAVYHNRLKIGMALQCDPTVLYALKKRSGLTYKDLEFDSPYNTYKYPGLPPGPICNPGLKSIRAALYPAKVNYLYFVAKGDGTHIFSTTLDEHNRAKRKIKKANSVSS